MDRVSYRRSRALAAKGALVHEGQRSPVSTGPALGSLLRSDAHQVGTTHERAGTGRGQPPNVPVLRGCIHMDTSSAVRTEHSRGRATAREESRRLRVAAAAIGASQQGREVGAPRTPVRAAQRPLRRARRAGRGKSPKTHARRIVAGRALDREGVSTCATGRAASSPAAGSRAA